MIGQHFETLIALASELKDNIDAMKNAYVCLPPLIEREHKSIKSGIFSEAESICVEKSALVQVVETGFRNLTTCAEKIAQVTNKPVSSLSEIVAALQGVTESISSEVSLAEQVLKHVTKSVARSALELEEQAEKAKPIIEANRDLVSHLAASYSRSYLFWQEIQEQVSSSYTPDGTQKVVGRVSGFRARA